MPKTGASTSVTSSGGQRRQVHHLEARGGVAQQPMRARDVAGGQHEAVRALRQRVEQIAEDVAQAGEAFERPQLEHFVEQERARLAARRARRVEEREQGVERLARRCRRRLGAVPREWRRRCHRLEKPLGRRGATLDVDVLHGLPAQPLAQTLQQPGAAGSASAEEYRNS